ncbi:MAG: tetratricopeptide repeat protein [Candidatus Hydrogenedentota bacterium]
MARAFRLFPVIMVSMVLLWDAPAAAWGPKAELTIVDFALNLLSSEADLPLKRKQREIRQGVMISQEKLADRQSAFNSNLARAIASEMYLLERVGRNGFDIYFAYRLGGLGKMVAMAASPMQEAPAVFRAAYDTDVENNIDRLSVPESRRDVVDPKSYIPRLQQSATGRDEMITRDYQEGTGFKGVARQSLASDAGRAVDAVADVWYTILTEDTLSAAVSDAELQRYLLGAYEYYIDRGNITEIEAAAERLENLVSINTAMREQIGDYFYEAGFYEQAMASYKQVLEEAPGNSAVIGKIADYYIEQGEALLGEEELEDALDAFETALEADPVNAGAQAKRLETERLIAEREDRRDEARTALDSATSFEAQAEEHAFEGYYVEAIAAYVEASHAYDKVTSEFPELYSRAQQGLRSTTSRIDELRDELIANVNEYSGSGNVFDLFIIADIQGRELDQDVLRSLSDAAYDETFDRLEEAYMPAVTP